MHYGSLFLRLVGGDGVGEVMYFFTKKHLSEPSAALIANDTAA